MQYEKKMVMYEFMSLKMIFAGREKSGLNAVTSHDSVY